MQDFIIGAIGSELEYGTPAIAPAHYGRAVKETIVRKEQIMGNISVVDEGAFKFVQTFIVGSVPGDSKDRPGLIGSAHGGAVKGTVEIGG